jgi:hypothetical protein
VVAAVRPVVDTDDCQWLGARQSAPPHDAEQRVVADGQHEPLCEPGTRPAAHCQAEVMNVRLKPAGAAGSLSQHRCAEPLGEHLALAAQPRTGSAARGAAGARGDQRTADPRVGGLSCFGRGARPHRGVGRSSRRRCCGQSPPVPPLPMTFSTVNPSGISDANPNRDTIDATLMNTTSERHRTAVKLSQSQICVPIDMLAERPTLPWMIA